jgi:hypothetical protein
MVKDAYNGAFERINTTDEEIDQKRAELLTHVTLNPLVNITKDDRATHASK